MIILICPFCESPRFLRTPDTFDLSDVLRRWEKDVGVVFSKEVWEQYTSPTLRYVTLYRCDQCGFAMFQPTVVGGQEFYVNITDKDERYYVAEKWEFRRAIRDIRRFGGRKILDIGCGTGYFLDLLRDSTPSADCAGYEFNPGVANIARSKGYTVYHGLFPESISAEIGGKLFDAITMFQVLEHLSDPVGFLKSAGRLLNPGGLLIIGVPDGAGPVRFFSSALTDIPPHHVTRWQESVFRQGMSRLGFSVISVKFEPLPYYLWSSYLPVILEGNILPTMIGKFLNSCRTTTLLTRLLTALRIKWLRGVRGHTLYVVLRSENQG